LDCATLEPNRDPISDLDLILNELALYEVPEGELPLHERPQLIALNKIDVPDGRELAEFVKPELEARGYKVFLISAVAREGLRDLNFALAELVKAHREAKAAVPARPRIYLMNTKREENKFTVKKEAYGDEELFRVIGPKPERWVAQTMFGNEEAVGYLGDRLAKLGLEDELLKAGAVAGSTVVIGAGKDGVIFDWEPTIASAGELIAAPRGTDPRLDLRERRTNIDRRREYQEMMDARAAMRIEMAKEGNPIISYEIGSVEDPDAKGEDEQAGAEDQK
jgi:GTP-binding protein